MSTKIKMTVPVRIRLLELLMNEEGRRSRLKLLRKLQESLGISEEEGKLIGFTENMLPNGRVESFIKHPEKDPEKEIEVGEVYLEIICNKLKSIEEQEKLKPEQCDLYDVFEPYIANITGPDKPKK